MSVIDDYFEDIEANKRGDLVRIRDIVRRLVPGTTDAIVYGMPTLKYKGISLIGFDAHTQHIGVYPFSGQAVEDLRDVLKDFSTTKGAIHVPLDKPISEEILKKIVDYRLKQIADKLESTK